MHRGLRNLTIDLLAAAGLLVMAATGYILRFALPPGTNRTHELWGISRHEWGMIHSWASVGLLLALCIHVVLHWEWIFATIHRRFACANAAPNQRRHAGIITVAVLITGAASFAWAAQMGVRELETPLHPLREPQEFLSPSLAHQRPPSGQAPIPQAVDFQRDILPIFEASCVGCHGSRKHSADLRESLFAEGDATPLIVPGNSEKSRLINIVSGEMKAMKSVEAHLLPPREIALLKAWIEAGADWPEEKRADQATQEP